MESIQSSRPLNLAESAPKKAREPGREAAGEADFERQLDQQMNRAEARETSGQRPIDEEKPVKNQEAAEQGADAEDVVDEVQADVESVKAETTPEQPVVAVAEPVLSEEATESSDETVPAEAAGLQNLPPEGNALPPAAVVDEAVASAEPVPAVVVPGQAVKTELNAEPRAATEAQAVVQSRPSNSPPNPGQQQPVALSQLVERATDADADPVSNKLPLGDNALTGKTVAESASTNALSGKGAQLASVASFASSMQQVHQATSASAMHMNINTSSIPMPDGASLNSLNSAMTTLNTPLQNPAWGQGVADRVAWMVQGNLQTAQIKLNPANLGPMEIKLSVQDDNKTQITFVSHHAPVRDALDSAMPRLREMLESQGIDLADVNVSDAGVQSNQQQDGGQSSGGSASSMSASSTQGGDDVIVNETLVRVPQADGLSIYA
jgi:flagellar hook-length control protein FliK